MRIAVWKTGHEIADTVADAIAKGLTNATIYHTDKIKNAQQIHDRRNNKCGCVICSADVHIGYGILRGTAEVFRLCDIFKKLWFNIDRGYFKPFHFDGYYRISLCGTQQTLFLDKLETDCKRFDTLGISINDYEPTVNGHILACPPTEHVVEFFGREIFEHVIHGPSRIRNKGCNRSLEEDFNNCRSVLTFNSSVGWEALRRGIQVNSDPIHSIVGSWQKMIDKPIHLDFNERHKLFGVMGDLQMTLEEIRNGHLCPLIEKMVNLYHQDKQQNTIYSLAGTAENR